jgi:hypothetical protein
VTDIAPCHELSSDIQNLLGTIQDNAKVIENIPAEQDEGLAGMGYNFDRDRLKVVDLNQNDVRVKRMRGATKSFDEYLAHARKLKFGNQTPRYDRSVGRGVDLRRG